jgi:hypothetical protein
MADGDRDVLSSLPRTRPERRSAKRDAPARKPRAKAAAKPSARRKPAPKAVPKRKVPPAGYAVPRHESPVGSGTGELVSTAVQAFGELANLGGRALRDALGRLPKP